MSRVLDWSTPRPWTAEPMDPKDPEGFWRVTHPSRDGFGREVLLTHLPEQDAKDIAAAGAKKEARP